MTALLALGLAMFSTALGLGLALPLIPLLAQNLGAGGLLVGIIFAANPLMRAALMPLSGRLSDMHGKKTLLLVGLLGNAGVALAFAVATDPWHLLAARMLQGALQAAVIPVALAYAGTLTVDGGEGSVMGMFSASLMAGFGLGPVIGGALATGGGMEVPFYFMAAATALAFTLVLLLVPEQKAVALEGYEKPPPFRLILSGRPVQGLLLSRALSSMCIGIFFTILPLYAARHLDMDSARVGTLITIQILSMTALQPLFGRMADRMDRVLMATAGLLVAPGAYLMIPLFGGFGPLAALSVVLGLSGAVFVPASTAMAVSIGRAMGMGSLMGLMEMALGLGMALGAVVAGAVSDAWSIAGTLGVAAVAGVAAAAALMLLARAPRAAVPTGGS